MARVTIASLEARIAELEAENAQLKAKLPRPKRELDPERIVRVVCTEFKCETRGRGPASRAVGWKCSKHS